MVSTAGRAPKPGRSSATGCKPAALNAAICGAHARAAPPIPCRNTTAGAPPSWRCNGVDEIPSGAAVRTLVSLRDVLAHPARSAGAMLTKPDYMKRNISRGDRTRRGPARRMRARPARSRQIIEHHERIDPRRVRGALDRGHVVVGVSILMLAGAEVRGRDADMVEIALVERRGGVIGLDRLAQHDLAGAQDRAHDRR